MVERFELSIVAQGSQSIWVAVLVIVIVCVTVMVVALSYAFIKTSEKPKKAQRR